MYAYTNIYVCIYINESIHIGLAISNAVSSTCLLGLLLLRMFDSLYGNCVAFSPDGNLLAIGFTNGLVKVGNCKYWVYPSRMI